MQFKTTLAIVAAAAVTAGCGGGGGGGAEVVAPSAALVSGTQVPVTATTSSDEAFTFASQLAGTSDGTAEPLVLGDATFATSETDEPKPL